MSHNIHIKRRLLPITSFLLTALVISICGCEKDQVGRRKNIDTSLLAGQWAETYESYRDIICVDGSSYYTFNEDGTYDLRVYDVFSGNVTTTTHFYSIEGNVITLNPATSDRESRSFVIVSLDDSRMEWQKVGTTFSENGLITDYKCFKRVKSPSVE